MSETDLQEDATVQQGVEQTAPVEPPAGIPEAQRGSWFAVPSDDPVVEYVRANLWNHGERPSSWEAARLSQAAYVYREKTTGWAIAAKFYAPKTGSSADKHAHRELEAIQQVRAAGLDGREMRAIEALSVWRGVLFLEYVDGLSLEDVIAVRRSRPGTLIPCLRLTARMLATLHACGTQPDRTLDFALAVADAHEYVGNLVRYGVLQDDPIVSEGLTRAIDHWQASPVMRDCSPGFVHGDATSSNFIFPWSGGVVAIDWERLDVADPAADLGRLMAEVAHSIKQQGGDVSESEYFLARLVEGYTESLPADWDAAALVQRARFYRATSTLRIARNGWLSRLDRTALVAQALALLS